MLWKLRNISLFWKRIACKLISRNIFQVSEKFVLFPHWALCIRLEKTFYYFWPSYTLSQCQCRFKNVPVLKVSIASRWKFPAFNHNCINLRLNLFSPNVFCLGLCERMRLLHQTSSRSENSQRILLSKNWIQVRKVPASWRI